MKMIRCLFILLLILAGAHGAKADCIPPFTWNYVASHMESTDGTNMYISANITGSATMAPASCFGRTGIATHTPGLSITMKNNRTGVTTGGFSYGPAQNATYPVNFTNNQSVPANTDSYTITETGNMNCLFGGLFWTWSSISFVMEFATTLSRNMGSVGGGSWLVQSWCTAATTPPDFNPSLVLVQPYHQFYVGLAACVSTNTLSHGWHCTPGADIGADNLTSPWECTKNPPPY